ncbi:calcium/calmodulin-dependent 3',5'-cyclic nucleotide phosphodiesterase 1A-like isoform X8 [Venturia canescens]|uniref:calcium/calmodulin-dependent 3',5'-cyclic nucleotide phosphodiesterase 1A-like isoform X8 n=1 Tax=Venturia canescens TaxID=32260 RepID=UPI001C9C93F3|nr:calcium/calmodulin-dependent 3',5'-cyclic nucleotide phosphodiesterase 1A-like isoform X8 [Venturia canescens]
MSRQNKDPIHKCHSDPGAGDRNITPISSHTSYKRISRRHVLPSLIGSSATRKCVLTLDGYNYVIVASPPDRRSRDEIDTSTSSPATASGIVNENVNMSGTSGNISTTHSHNPPSPGRNGQLSKQGTLTIVRRSSAKGKSSAEASIESSILTNDPETHLRGRSVDSGEDFDNVDFDTESLPAVDTPDACDKAALRLRCLLRQLEHGEISADLLQRNLHYAARVLEAVFIDETKRLADEDDELSEVQPDAVPPEVREWLASTFTRQLATTKRKADEKPKFRSVAHAIRAGIFVERISRRVTNTALMQFPPDVVKVLKTLDDWSFDAFSLNDAAMGAPVKYLGYDLLNRYGMIHKFKVPPIVLENFLSRVEEGYCRHRNPYHNNLHAADVAQTMHWVLCQTGLMNWLSDLEIFATLVAAIIHDYEHTGTTNNFHVMSGSDTALLYNDRAVLENHHISASFRILREDECNILQNLAKEEFREFRSLVIDMVLATDMSFHFQQLKNMKNLLSLAESSVDKSKAVSLVLHCCDISHPAKRWNLHHRWTMQLLEEFFRQGDKEQALGLPFSPLCDRNNTLVAESQIGFIEFIVEPSMQVCSDMLETVLGPLNNSKERDSEDPKNGSLDERRCKIQKPWVQCLAENKKFWKEQAIRDADAKVQKEQRQKTEDQLNVQAPQTDA